MFFFLYHLFSAIDTESLQRRKIINSIVAIKELITRYKQTSNPKDITQYSIKLKDLLKSNLELNKHIHNLKFKQNLNNPDIINELITKSVICIQKIKLLLKQIKKTKSGNKKLFLAYINGIRENDFKKCKKSLKEFIKHIKVKGNIIYTKTNVLSNFLYKLSNETLTFSSFKNSNNMNRSNENNNLVEIFNLITEIRVLAVKSYENEISNLPSENLTFKEYKKMKKSFDKFKNDIISNQDSLKIIESVLTKSNTIDNDLVHMFKYFSLLSDINLILISSENFIERVQHVKEFSFYINKCNSLGNNCHSLENKNLAVEESIKISDQHDQHDQSNTFYQKNCESHFCQFNHSGKSDEYLNFLVLEFKKSLKCKNILTKISQVILKFFGVSTENINWLCSIDLEKTAHIIFSFHNINHMIIFFDFFHNQMYYSCKTNVFLYFIDVKVIWQHFFLLLCQLDWVIKALNDILSKFMKNSKVDLDKELYLSILNEMIDKRAKLREFLINN
ncbi:hypothetical protein DMUE_0135 [Dictyocoela muelleri]|nr:hypothetical protein DMUE_0135 [Dictyocoela muelleri]